jgi:cyclohexyl-isocyanide hydratase
MDTNRRNLTALLSLSSIVSALPPLLASGRASAQEAATVQPITMSEDDMMAEHEAMMKAIPGLNMNGSEQIAMVLYPGFTTLDFVGPYFFLGGLGGAKVHLVTTQDNLDPVVSDMGLAIVPTIKMADLPPELDVILLPGGSEGTLAMMQDRTIRTFLQSRVATTRYITSVCTGSMILAAAGLLKGRKATSHWTTRPVLADFGAIPVEARYVQDGQFLTGAGVSAGLDMAIQLVRLLRGDPYAQAVMLGAEYAPKPPIRGGTYVTTEPQLAMMMKDMFGPLTQACQNIAKANNV